MKMRSLTSLIALVLLCLSFSAGCSSSGNTQPGDKDHPAWMIGSWMHRGTDSGSSTSYTLNLWDDGTFRKDSTVCSPSGCTTTEGILIGDWRGDTTQLWLNGEGKPHESRNCALLYGHGTTYTKELPSEVSCPFEIERLSAGERCLVGPHKDVSGSNTISTFTRVLEANRLYRYTYHIDMVYSPDSTSYQFGYWTAKNGQIVIDYPGDKETETIPIQVDPATDTCLWWDSTYDHTVEDQACDPSALGAPPCNDGDFKCDGESLDQCVNGTWSTPSCATVCQDSGFTLPNYCGYHQDKGHDVCFCFSGEIGEPCGGPSQCKSNFCGAGVCSKACTGDADCGTDGYGRQNHCMLNNSGSESCYSSCNDSSDCERFSQAKNCLTGVTNVEGKAVAGVCTT